MQFPVSPVAFEIGPLSVRWYGLFLALAVVWLVFWVWWQIKKGAKIDVDTMLTLALVGVPSGIIFARILHVIDNIVVAKLHPEYALSGQVFDYTHDWGRIIGGEGLTAWGAVLGASLGCWIYCKLAKKEIGYIFDLIAPAIIMAQAIGRVGCLLNGCCYGIPTTLPWGLEYTNPQSLGFDAGVTHPTVAYEIIFNVIAFTILLKMRGKFRPAGSVYILYLSFYSAWRIGVDFIRDGTPFLFGLHQAQVISIIILLITIPWMIMKMRPGKPEYESIMSTTVGQITSGTMDSTIPAESEPAPLEDTDRDDKTPDTKE